MTVGSHRAAWACSACFALTLFCIACRVVRDDPAGEAVARTSQALTSPGGVLGFETAAAWHITGTGGTLSTSDQRVQGGYSLAVTNPDGWTVITSDPLATGAVAPVNGRLSFDLLQPTLQVNAAWLGAVQLYVEIPSLQLFNAYVGQVELTGLPTGSFQTVQFNVPAPILTALTQKYDDLVLRIALNIPVGNTGTYLLDAFGIDALTPRLECITQPTPTEFRAVFGFDNELGASVTIAPGSTNRFSPSPADRGQPTTFPAGLHRATFFVPFDGSSLTWTLGNQSVTATSATPHCDGTETAGQPIGPGASIDPDRPSEPDPLVISGASRNIARAAAPLAAPVSLAVVNGQRADTGPVGVLFHGKRYIAYSGTDSDNHPNVLVENAACPLSFGPPRVLQNDAVLGGAGVGLAVYGDQLVLAFTGNDHQVNLEFSDDGNTWTGKQVCGFALSDRQPSVTAFGGRLVVAFEGTTKQLNVFSTDGGDCNDPNHRLSFHVLGDTSTHGVSITSYAGDLYLGWTGEGDGFPNLARLADFGASEAKHIVFSSDTSDDGTAIAGVDGRLVLSFRGAGNQHVNYAALTASQIAALSGNAGLPGKFSTGDDVRTNTFPGLADFGSTIALLWTGTDSQVNFRENGVREVFTPPVLMCAAWPAKYIDTGFGETGAPAAPLASQRVPASFAELDRLIDGNRDNVFLDETGCVDVTSLYFGSNGDPSSSRSAWKVRVDTIFEKSSPSGPIDWKVAAVPDAYKTLNNDGSPNNGNTSLKQRNAIFGEYETDQAGCQPPAPGGVISIAPPDPPQTDVTNTDLTNVAAVTSRILSSADMGIAPGTYWSFAGDVCDGALGSDPESLAIRAARDSCYSPASDALFIGTSLPPGLCPANEPCLSQSYWKYVIAHETGHMLQAHSVGSFRPSYTIPVSAPSVCSCRHVAAANQVHCLQSVDDSAAAQIEGFAQFFSSRTWNGQNDPGCTFVYYKEFLDPDAVPCPANRTCREGPVSMTQSNGVLITIPAGFHSVLPPLGVDCRQPVEWRNRQCTAGGDFATLGTEYDWMGFLYNINTVDAPAGSRFSQDDINASYTTSCGGGQRACEGVAPTFTSLRDGVVRQFGQSDPRTLRFAGSALTYGVGLSTTP